ncbi:MAG TPA: TetR/AcrR family transcriptional regulator [Jiangellaceae bacterium]|nr:TetR/AcrR family transcriptional regulator [Jiangellaceae bacterium]
MTTHLPNQRATDGPPLSRRERARAATIDEIKETATRLMTEQGTTDLRFSDIAREMGMTAPALYRYFADRDELLTALIADTYDELGAIVAAARERVPADDVWGRFLAVADAYRSWAKREPVRFTLIFGMPVPGYAAPEDGPTTEAAIRAMSQLKAIFFDAAERGELAKPLLGDVDKAILDCMEAERQAHPDEPEPRPETFQAMLHCWASLHGFASLEAHGHLNWLPEDARQALFVSCVRLAAITAGLPVPPR